MKNVHAELCGLSKVTWTLLLLQFCYFSPQWARKQTPGGMKRSNRDVRITENETETVCRARFYSTVNYLILVAVWLHSRIVNNSFQPNQSNRRLKSEAKTERFTRVKTSKNTLNFKFNLTFEENRQTAGEQCSRWDKTLQLGTELTVRDSDGRAHGWSSAD